MTSSDTTQKQEEIVRSPLDVKISASLPLGELIQEYCGTISSWVSIVVTEFGLLMTAIWELDLEARIFPFCYSIASV